MDCLPYFKEGMPLYVFGKKVTNNGVLSGDTVCNTSSTTILDAGKLNNLDGIDTMAYSKANFSNREQTKAQLVQHFQHINVHPSNDRLVYSSITNGINNSPITREDVLITLKQSGKGKYAVQGKTVRQQPGAVDASEA